MDALVEAYFQALKREMSLLAEDSHISQMCFDTIYFGGGTPSLVPAEYICQIIEQAQELFSIEHLQPVELTIECNPDSVSPEMLRILKEEGLNRVSLGVQSMSDRDLRFLGRVHDSHQVLQAVDYIRDAGIQNMSLDLIYAIPGQDEEQLSDCLERVFVLGPEHLSCYELTIEQGTFLEQAVKSGKVIFPSQETRLSLTILVEEELEAHGYRQYEISNFARPGFESRHNIGYWSGRQYLGLGCSACSYLNNRRIRNLAGIEDYLHALTAGRLPVDEVEELDQEARFREALVMALRMNQGADLWELAERYGIDATVYYGSFLEEMVDSGLISFHNMDRVIALTRKGRHIANYILSYLV